MGEREGSESTWNDMIWKGEERRKEESPWICVGTGV